MNHNVENNVSIILREYGLTEKELELYLKLVEKGRLTAYALAKETKIHKSTCYDVLDKLIEKGFVVEIIENNKKFFSSNEINAILARIKNKETLLLSIVPEIEKLRKQEETYAKYSESKNAFADFDIKMYNCAKEGKMTFLYMISNSPELTTQSSRILIKRLLNEIKAGNFLKKIDGKAIWDEKFREDIFMRQFSKLGKNKFLNDLPCKATTFIFDGRVIFVSLTNVQMVTEIKNELISNEMKKYFEYLWKMAKE
jgi:sugar-specific transcriptional regulator TrmB